MFKNVCICYGIEDIHEQILKLHESKLIIGEITNNKSDGIHLPNIYDKEYFENVALKYLKALPSNITYYDAKYNILKNMEMVEDYPLLKEVLIHVNPVETIRTGLDLIGGKVALRYQITVADVLFQLHENDKNVKTKDANINEHSEIVFTKEEYLKHLSEDIFIVKYKERSTGKTFEINPKIDNSFYDTFYRNAFRSGEYILISGELPDKWK